MSRLLTIALMLALAFPATAAETKFDPDRIAKSVAPYLDSGTVAVAHVDLSRLDAKSLVEAFARLSGMEAKELARVRQRLQLLLTGFRKAGGKEVYAVFSLLDVHAGSFFLSIDRREGPFFVVPADGQARLLTAFLTGVVAKQGLSAEKIGPAVVVGPKATLQRLRKLKPVERPELARALAAVGDAAAHAVLLPPADLRRAIEELFSEVPEELGGGSTKDLTRALQWAAVGMSVSPAVQMFLTMQTPNADSAQTLHAALTRLTKALVQRKEVRELLPNVDRIVPLAIPSVAIDRLALVRNEKELTTMVRPILEKFHPPLENQTTDNLQAILRAMLAYEKANQHFPAAASYDKQNKLLLSWRVHILPYLGEERLYKQFHLDEPWDSEHNQKLIARMPAVFRSSENTILEKAGKTTFLAPTGEATMFPGQRGLGIADVPDGTANTIFLVDAEDDRAVVWTKPEDLPYDPKDPARGLALRYSAGYIVGMVDGSVRVLSKKISKSTLQAAFTRNAGDLVGADF